MLDFEEKRKIKSIIYSKISLLIVVVLFFFVAKGAWNAYDDAKITKENKEMAKGELQELENREKNILSEIEILSTQEGKEKEIRSKFQVAKEGEQMIMIVDPKEDRDFDETDNNKSLWQRFLNIFK